MEEKQKSDKEKHISWKMYNASFFIVFVLILMSYYDPDSPAWSMIWSAMVAFPAALFLCSGWNMLSK